MRSVMMRMGHVLSPFSKLRQASSFRSLEGQGNCFHPGLVSQPNQLAFRRRVLAHCQPQQGEPG